MLEAEELVETGEDRVEHGLQVVGAVQPDGQIVQRLHREHRVEGAAAPAGAGTPGCSGTFSTDSTS